MRPHTVAVLASVLLTAPAVHGTTRRAVWSDLPTAVQRHLAAQGIETSDFSSTLERIEKETVNRLRDGDWEALVYYALQARSFTSLPAIEPALSAKMHHEQRAVPADAQARLDALADVLREKRGLPSFSHRQEVKTRAVPVSPDERLEYFRDLVAGDPRVSVRGLAPVLAAEYERVMRFLYDKEFAAAREKRDVATDAGASLYQQRGYSTDTGVEAGYAVRQALGVIQSLNPSARLRRVLVVGPGLTLASRTGLVDEIPPQSYQPYGVLDDLLSLDLATVSEVTIDCVDINPRVVSHIERLRTTQQAPALELLSAVPDQSSAPLTPEYRTYFGRWGRAIGSPVRASTPPLKRLPAHLHRSIRLSPDARARVHAARGNIITDRLEGPPYELVIATNLLTYFDEVELLLGLANVAGIVAPGGHFVHNETRETLIEVADQIGLPIVHTRTVVFTQPTSSAEPLYDRIWIHQRSTRKGLASTARSANAPYHGRR
ncbi:MAG: hypothetical protein GEV06_14955 [Luteitalea sp.]|nr:hypothetical protein [Luteitalea sp.]